MGAKYVRYARQLASSVSDRFRRQALVGRANQLGRVTGLVVCEPPSAHHARITPHGDGRRLNTRKHTAGEIKCWEDR